MNTKWPELTDTNAQPAEQQPTSHDWDDQDKCRRCGDRDWYASATCTPKQPDVAKLRERVKVLEEALTDAANYTRHRDYDWDMGFIKHIDQLLATKLHGGSDHD